MPSKDQPPSSPPSPDAPPTFDDGAVPEAPATRRGLLIFALLAVIGTGLALLRTISRGTPFLLVGGIYFPTWFSAGVTGTALAVVSLIALRSHPLTRAAGTALVFFNLSVIYAFLAWLFLFS
jgi:hypothetical protein